METKICVDCGKELPIEAFYIAGKYKDKISRNSFCKKCRHIRRAAYQKQYRKDNKDKVNTAKRNYYKIYMEDPNKRASVNEGQRRRSCRYAVKRLYDNAKTRANRRGLSFDLTVEDIIIPEICPILEIPLFTGTKGNYNNSPSLDRIDNTKGYIKGNVAVISSLANSMKNQATFKQLYTFQKNILNYCKITNCQEK